MQFRGQRENAFYEINDADIQIFCHEYNFYHQ